MKDILTKWFSNLTDAPKNKRNEKVLVRLSPKQKAFIRKRKMEKANK